MPKSTSYDTIVIGAGSAGLSFSKRASSNGASVLLIEKAQLGGTCTNRGCVPKKLFWHAARTLAQFRDLEEMGTLARADGRIDLGALRDRVVEKIERIHESMEAALDDAGVELHRGEAEVSQDGKVTIAGEALEAKYVVLATGAKPVLIDIEGGELCSTSDDVLAWTDLPKRILIAGGGYIGCELATTFNAFGSEITLVDPGKRLLAGFDADAVEVSTHEMKRGGITLHLETEPTRVTKGEDGLRVELSNGKIETFDKVISAVGRKPDLDALGRIGETLTLAESGAVAVDERFTTNVECVHALGDLADRMQLTPVATRDGEALADMLFGKGAERPDLANVTTSAFLQPPLAQIGDMAPEGGHIEKDAVAPLGAWAVQPSAYTDGKNFWKIARRADGGLSGIALISETAADEIGWAAATITSGLDRQALRQPVPVHPTFSEEVLGG